MAARPLCSRRELLPVYIADGQECPCYYQSSHAVQTPEVSAYSINYTGL